MDSFDITKVWATAPEKVQRELLEKRARRLLEENLEAEVLAARIEFTDKVESDRRRRAELEPYNRYIKHGNEFFKMGQYPEAIEQWEMARSTMGGRPDVVRSIAIAYTNWAAHLYRKELFDEAHKKLLKALEYNQCEAGAHFYLGLCARERGLDAVAVEHLKNAIDNDPENFAYHAALYDAYGALGQKNEQLNEAKKLVPLADEEDQGQCAFYAGYLCAQLEKWEETLVYFRKAEEYGLSDHGATILLSLVSVFALLGRRDLMDEELLSLCREVPPNPIAFLSTLLNAQTKLTKADIALLPKVAQETLAKLKQEIAELGPTSKSQPGKAP